VKAELLRREYLLSLLLPGDLLLYASSGLMGRGIQIKTSSKVTHCEIYIGSGRTIASRDGIGVDTYDFETKNLAMVLRPKEAVDMAAMVHWHVSVAKGQGYDWAGLFMGFIARKWGRENGKMFCSEHTTRAYRQGGIHPFRVGVDADSISPGDLFKSAAFNCRWINAALAKDLDHGQVETSADGSQRSGAHCPGSVAAEEGRRGAGEGADGAPVAPAA
jgi:hypothetical protein